MSKTFKIVDGDVVPDGSGKPVMIADKANLNQLLQENMTIETQPSGVGAGIESLVGGNDVNIKVDLYEKLSNSIAAIRSVQDKYVRTSRPAEERVIGIDYLNADVVQGSVTDYIIRVDVGTADGQTVKLAGIIPTVGG